MTPDREVRRVAKKAHGRTSSAGMTKLSPITSKDLRRMRDERMGIFDLDRLPAEETEQLIARAYELGVDDRASQPTRLRISMKTTWKTWEAA